MKKTPEYLEWAKSIRRTISQIKIRLVEPGLSDSRKMDLWQEWARLAHSYNLAESLWDSEDPLMVEPQVVSPTYKVICGDNFHPYEETDVDSPLGQASYIEAVAAAKRLIERSLRWERAQSKNPKDPAEVFERYLDFGDSVTIRPDGDPPFSGIQYAEEAAVWICREPV